jgi:hypothetical protein
MVKVKTRRTAETVRARCLAAAALRHARARTRARADSLALSHSCSQPPAVAAVQAPLLLLPLSELGRALAGFVLPPSDNKPDLLHWLPLLNRLDELLERAAKRPDVALTGAAAEPFPTEEVVAALRCTAALLDYSHNRQLYGSAEVRAACASGARNAALLRAAAALAGVGASRALASGAVTSA